MRRLLIVATALLALACGQRKDDGTQAATPATTAPTERAPDAPPATSAAISGYEKARRVATGVLARPLDPTLVHRAVDDWAAADQALRRIGRDARAGEVASLLVAGAAEQPRDVGTATAEQWRAIGALVIAVVLEDATRDRLEQAGSRLLAVATLGRDVGDAATVDAAARACAVVAAAARDDAALAEACATMAERGRQ